MPAKDWERPETPSGTRSSAGKQSSRPIATLRSWSRRASMSRCRLTVDRPAHDACITMADLKGTLDHFAASMFGEGIVTRLRPSYFPFTEPSAEVDVQCFVCRGASVGNPDAPCRTCSSEGWIEWGGCGMVN